LQIIGGCSPILRLNVAVQKKECNIQKIETKRNQQQPAELSDSYNLRVFISFESLSNIPKEEFTSIEEWHSGNERSYLIGTIPYQSLIHKHWWKTNNNSLILMPDNIVENSEVSELKKMSLSLAGLDV
jgi:hypothetical protein